MEENNERVNAIKIIKDRRSVRNYINKPIPKEILEDIVDCARLAPSANNAQPWEFVVVTNKKKLETIASVCTYGAFIKDAAACIVVCGNVDSKHLIEDGCAATENILLAARAYDIGSCWVAGWKRTYNDQIKTLLNIPENIDIVSILSLGYHTIKPKQYGKKNLNDVLHWEKY